MGRLSFLCSLLRRAMSHAAAGFGMSALEALRSSITFAAAVAAAMPFFFSGIAGYYQFPKALPGKVFTAVNMP